MIDEKLEQYDGKDIRIGKIPFKFEIRDGEYIFHAKTTNRYGIGELRATPYNFTNEYSEEPQTRVKVYHGGETAKGFVFSDVSEAYTGLFKDALHYFDVVEKLALSVFE